MIRRSVAWVLSGVWRLWKAVNVIHIVSGKSWQQQPFVHSGEAEPRDANGNPKGESKKGKADTQRLPWSVVDISTGGRNGNR